MDRTLWRQIAIPAGYVLLVGIIAIFVHSGLQGQNGLAAFRDAAAEERRLLAELNVLQADRHEIQNKVRRLSERYLDLDLLDERARAVLGLIREDEIVIR
ncbi:MAG: septum formation initiator family protein [Pseudomonadota bacterium]